MSMSSIARHRIDLGLICLPDIRAGDSQIVSAVIEAQILHLVAILQLNGANIFQFTQIP